MSEWGTQDPEVAAPPPAQVPSWGAADPVVTAPQRSIQGLADLADAAADKHGIPRDLFRAMVHQESAWNPRAQPRNPDGSLRSSAKGLTQLIDSTAQEMGVEDPFDPEKNLAGGAKYLAMLHDEFGDWDTAIGAYHDGPTSVSMNGLSDAARQHLAAVKRRMGALAPPPEPEQAPPEPEQNLAGFAAWKVKNANLPAARAAQVWQLAQERKLPPEWVAEHFDEVQKAVEEEDTKRILQTHPGLQKVFDSWVSGSAVKDELANASVWERLLGRADFNWHAEGGFDFDYTAPTMWRALGRGVDDARKNYLGLLQATGRADLSERAELKRLEEKPPVNYGDDLLPGEESLYKLGEMSTYLGPHIALGLAAGAAAGAAVAAGVPAAVAGATATGVVMGVGFVYDFLSTIGPAHEQILKATENDEGIPQVDPDKAFNLAVGASAVGAAIFNGSGLAMQTFTPGVKRALGTTIADTVGKVLTEKNGEWALKMAFAAGGKSFAAGLAMIGGQAVATNLAAQQARISAGQQRKLDPWEAAQSFGEAVKEAFGPIGLMSTFHGVHGYIGDMGRVGRAQLDGAKFQALAESTRNSKLPPAQLEQVLATLRQGNVEAAPDMSTAYVELAAFNKAAEAEGVPPAELAAKINDDGGAAYSTAMKQGPTARIAFPIEKYIARAIKSGLHEAHLKGDVAFSADGWTLRQETEHRDAMKKYAQGYGADERQQIRDSYIAQAVAAGRTVEEARANVDLFVASIGTYAAKKNITPLQALRELKGDKIQLTKQGVILPDEFGRHPETGGTMADIASTTPEERPTPRAGAAPTRVLEQGEVRAILKALPPAATGQDLRTAVEAGAEPGERPIGSTERVRDIVSGLPAGATMEDLRARLEGSEPVTAQEVADHVRDLVMHEVLTPEEARRLYSAMEHEGVEIPISTDLSDDQLTRLRAAEQSDVATANLRVPGEVRLEQGGKEQNPLNGPKKTLGPRAKKAMEEFAQNEKERAAAKMLRDDLIAAEKTLGPRPKGSASGLRSGRENLLAYGIDPSKKVLGRDLAVALEKWQRDRVGHIAADDFSDEASKKIAKWMADEVAYEHLPGNRERNGTGWYSTKWQRAIDAFGEIFPTLKPVSEGGSQADRNLFTALVAITSDGEKVYSNFKYATALFKQFKTTGELQGITTYRGANENVQRIQALLKEHGPEKMHEYLLQEDTVQNLRAAAREAGIKFSSDYKGDVKLPRAALIFGPKLGAFYANLMGSHGYLTMDRWWSRTFNRYRGELIPKPVGLKGSENEFNSKGEKQGVAAFKELFGKPKMSDEAALREVVRLHDLYEAAKFKHPETTDPAVLHQQALEKAANTIYKAAYLETNDTPNNASDRSFMIDTVERARDILRKQGINISVADVQAVLWYHEKRLWAEQGVRASADVSYEETAKRIVDEWRAAGSPKHDDPGSDFGFLRKGGESAGVSESDGPPAPDAIQGPDGAFLSVGPGAAGEAEDRAAADAERTAIQRGERVTTRLDQPPIDLDGSKSVVRLTTAGFQDLFERVRQPWTPEHPENGGFTYHPETDTEPTKGFALSVYPERSRGIRAVDMKPADITHYIYDNADLFADPENHVGAWHDPDTGKVILDVSTVKHDEKEAASLALSHDQKAYWDLEKKQTITVNRDATSGGAAIEGGAHGDDQAAAAPPLGGEPLAGEGGRDLAAPVPEALGQGADAGGGGAGEGGGGRAREAATRLEQGPGTGVEAKLAEVDAKLQRLTDSLVEQYRSAAPEMDYGRSTILSPSTSEPRRVSPEERAHADVWGATASARALELRRERDHLRQELQSLSIYGRDARERLREIYEEAGVNGIRELRREVKRRADEAWVSDQDPLLKLGQEAERLVLAARSATRLDQGPRGHMLIIDGPKGKRYEIHIGPGADKTTLAHETFHWLVDSLGDAVKMPDAPAEVKADYESLVKWMGYESSSAREKGLVAKYEERATHAWEQWLGEGKAPTPELEGTFRRFAKWMKKAYAAVAGGVNQVFKQGPGQGEDIGMTDEVRNIFRRILATDEELQGMPDPLDRKALGDTRADPAEVRRQSARQLLEGKPLSEISPAQHLAAERTAARQAYELALAGKKQEALDADTQRKFARALYSVAKELRDEGEKAIAGLDRLRRSPKALAKLGKHTVDVLDADGNLTDTRQPYLEQFSRLLSGLETRDTSKPEMDRRRATQQWIDSERADGRDPIVPESVLNNLDKQTRMRDLPLNEILDIKDAVDNLFKLAELKTTLLDKGRRVDAEQGKAELVAAAQANVDVVPISREYRTIEDKAAHAVKLGRTALTRIETLITRLDGGDRVNGVWRRLVWNPINDAFNEFYLLADKTALAVVGHIEALPKEELKRWVDTRFMVNGREEDLRAALAVALNMGTESNYRKMVSGWMRADVARRMGYTPWKIDTAQEFIKHLTARDWDLVQKIWDSLESLWPASDNLEKRLTGLGPKKVPPREFTVQTADGQTKKMRGGYYPMIYDPLFSRQGAAQETTALPGLFDPAYARAATPQGRLISRIESFSRPVSLSIDPLARAITDSAKDITMREAALSVFSILQDDKVRAAVQSSAIGDKGHRALLGWLRDSINEFATPDNGGKALEQWAARAKSRVTATIFGFNIAQTLQNLTGIASSVRTVGAKWVGEALLQQAKGRQEMWDFVNSKSKEMATRSVSDHLNLREALRDLSVPKSQIEAFNDAAIAFWEFTDKAVAYPTWMAEYNRSLASVEDGGRGLSEEKAIALADSTVRQFVMAQSTKDLPPALRNKFLRTFMPFFGFMNHRYNVVELAAVDARAAEKAGTKHAYLKAMSGVMALLVTEAILSDMATAHGPKKKKDEGPVQGKDWVKHYLAVAATTPLTLVPILGSVARSMESGRDINFSPESRAWTTLAKLGTTTAETVTNMTQNKPWVDKAMDAALLGAELGGTAMGLPVVQGKATLGYAKALATGEQHPRGVGDVALGLAFGKSNSAKEAFYGPQRPPPTRH